MAKMKDSGIQWIGEIPEHWECKKTKYCFQNKKEIAGIKSYKYERLALTMKGVIKRSKEANDGLQPENFDTYQIVRKKDIIFKLIDLQNISTSRVGLSNFDGIVSPAYIRIEAIKDINPYYAEKFYNMLWKNNIFNFLGDAGVRSSLNSTDLLNIEIIVPPLEEQNKIAKFLDKKCEIIDDSISDIENQIETLEQYRNSFIIDTISKGLDNNCKMKDGNIGWITQIPEHWEVAKIGFLYDVRNTKVSDVDYPPLSVTKKGVLPQLETVAKTNAHDDRKLVKKGDFAINSRSDRRGSCGISDYDGSVSLINIVLKPEKIIENRYFNWVFHTSIFADEFYKWGHGIVDDLWTTTWQDMKNILVAIPPLQEQKQIADYLDLKCGEIDKIIAGKRDEIETLNEYKKSLIFEYVTGKKEVPNE